MRSYRALTLLWLLIFAALMLSIIISGSWPLEAEEAQYWDWSRHLDWSYYSKGPLVAYLIALSTRLGGHTELWVRLPAVLLGVGVAGIAYLLARRIFQSECAGFLSVVVLCVTPLYAVGFILMTTDTPFIFCWGLAILFLCRAVQRRSEGFWYGAGIAFGFGLLSKYTMLMLLPCVLLWLLLSPKLRPWLRRREPYEAFLLGLLIFSPVLIWNARHGWISSHHVLTQATGGASRWTLASLLGGLEFLGVEVLLGGILLFGLMLCAVGWAWRQGIRQGRDDFLLLACTSAPVFLFFQLWSFLSKVQGNWAAHAYFTAIVAVAGWADAGLHGSESHRATRQLRRWLVASIIVPAVILSGAYVLDTWAPFGLRIRGRFDLVSKRLRGWPELGRAVGQAIRAATRPPFLVSDRYQIASELAFYVPGCPTVFNANLGRRMNQYDIWGGWEQLIGRDGLFVTYGADEPPAALRSAFAEVRRVRVVPIRHRGEHLRDFSIYWGREFRGFPSRPFAGY